MTSESGWGNGVCAQPDKELRLPSGGGGLSDTVWRGPAASSALSKCRCTWLGDQKATCPSPHGPSHLLTLGPGQPSSPA